MNQKLRFLCVLLALVLMATTFAGCDLKGKDNESSVSEPSASSSLAGPDTSETSGIEDAPEVSAVDYGKGLNAEGYWEGFSAKDLVELFDYKAFKVSAADIAVEDDKVQAKINEKTASFNTTNQVTDRAVIDGDTVNIDYVGSVDGVEFDGGSTGGGGTDVTIGVTSYIDDFLEQLIGHTPGETFDINVTFPDEYQNEELEGKDAVFVTTINHIVETVPPELTDAFVEENFSESDGWKTADEMKAEIRKELERESLLNYIKNYMNTNVTVSSIPEEVMEKQEDLMIGYYVQYAAYVGVDMEEFLESYMGVTTTEELVEQNKANNEQAATFFLVVQAIAEDMEITVTDEDLLKYFNTSDYSSYEEEYGIAYIKQAAMQDVVLNYIADNAVIEPA